MRKVIVSEFVTLDGVMEEPTWIFPYWNDEIARFKQDELFAVDALLLGRVTYEGFAEAWLPRTDEEDYADRMSLQLVNSEVFDSGVVALTCRPTLGK
jgi:dihydrofolate reductase